MKLIVTNDHPPKGPYMTLSHRWGSEPYTKLDSSTIRQFQNAIDILKLPRAFQDAIQIARNLDIGYLWIDSLCIKQDPNDSSDWERESLTMDKVYSNSFLNVSATMSVDGSEPLFQERYGSALLPSEIVLENNGLSITYYIIDHDIWLDEISNAPLNQRGWVYQERFLAPRILHFGKRQMAWECKHHEALEIFPKGLPKKLLTMSTSKRAQFFRKKTKSGDSSESTPDIDFLIGWQSLVSRYSQCRLTYSTDKLVAFAGVGKSMAGVRNDRYANGMLEQNLLYDLAWWRSTDDCETFPINITSSRAPSWSWASVDGEINFPILFHGVKARFVKSLEFSGYHTSAGDLNLRLRAESLCLPFSIEWLADGLARFRVAHLLNSK